MHLNAISEKEIAVKKAKINACEEKLKTLEIFQKSANNTIKALEHTINEAEKQNEVQKKAF
jgi:hypothetical protein